MPSAPVIVLGAGPAGLTAAHELAKAGVQCSVLEAEGDVGGLARTVEHQGYRFDIGGHRFFTRVPAVEQWWKEMLGPDLLTRPRRSSIYYRRRYFRYPLQPLNALANLGPVETLRCLLSYARSAAAPVRPEDNFAAWVSNRFGRRLFEIFFKTYTEKVWGVACEEIRAEWAAQRIQNLSLTTAVANALFGGRSGEDAPKTLIDEFYYPRLGPGMMWQAARERIEQLGSEVVLNAPVESVVWQPGRVTEIIAGGSAYPGESFISSIAVRDLIEALNPAPPAEVLAAARRLRYRDFLTVALIVDEPEVFADNWIYIHEPDVRLGRIQNFKNWSPEMVPDSSKTCLGLEYFCFEGDGLWSSSDEELIALGKRELAQLGLAEPEKIVDGVVVRARKAYPVYDSGYAEALETVRGFLSGFKNLQLVGRNGMHRYNNQDHSMLTAMLAARNLTGGSYDLWNVNADQDYNESGASITLKDLRNLNRSQPRLPEPLQR